MVKDRLEEFQKKANLTNSDQDDKLPEQFPAQDDKLPEQFPAQDDKLSERKMTNSLKNSLLKVTNFLHRNQPSPSKSTEFLSEEHWEDVENFLDHIKYLNCKIAEMGEDLKHMREINDTILNSPFADPSK
uniref:Uncharacterized protein n=1 Tax=Acrobeloides nanus TaxID=290746 RepID=A0A914CU51_9BILA